MPQDVIRYTAEGPVEGQPIPTPSGSLTLRLNFVDACTIQAALTLAVRSNLFGAFGELQRAESYRSQLFDFIQREGLRMADEVRLRGEDGRL